jgi:peptide/nickel transport system permease protein
MNRPLQDVGSLSQWQLIRLRFAKHRLAVLSLRILVILYFLALFAGFFAPYRQSAYSLKHIYSPPQIPQFNFSHGLHVKAVQQHVDPLTLKRSYTERDDLVLPLGFFVKGEPYTLLGFIPAKRRFFGLRNIEAYKGQVFYMLGGDKYGRDLLSRIIYGAQISLSVGVVGILISFVLGVTIGGISGYVGGAVDVFIQRLIEVINAFPKLPLWLALGAMLPADWSPLRIYFGITIVLSLMGWTGLARVVRGKLLSLREEDYAIAARLLGANDVRIVSRHLLPGMTSHIIVSLTLNVPRMILAETSLSFLGLGLRPPVVSWGVLLQDCMNMQVVINYPWLLLPVVFVVATVLSFNFLGDGLRDAADPYH